MKNLLHLIILTGILTVVAGAQSRVIVRPQIDGIKKDVVAARSASLTDFNLMGVQNDPGTCHKELEKCLGNTFVLSGESDNNSAAMTVTVNYTGFPSMFYGNKVDGGTWSMAVTRDGSYYGTIFGDVVGGQIKWTPDPVSDNILSRKTTASLRILGGLDGYEDMFNGSEEIRDLSCITKFSDGLTQTEGNFRIEL
jgi:hypothetical protein